MSDELEKRLRELVKRHQARYAYHGDATRHPAVERPVLLAMEAARIGAEIEREACACIADGILHDCEQGHYATARVAATDIRDDILARGDK